MFYKGMVKAGGKWLWKSGVQKYTEKDDDYKQLV